MSLSDLASLGSFVSGVAVFVSLIYLALQVRQNTMGHRAAAHQRVQEFWRQHQRLLLDPDTADVVLRGYNGDTTMTEAEVERFYAYARDWFAFHQESHWLSERGMLDSETVEVFDRVTEVALRFPGVRAALQNWKFGLAPKFYEYVAAESIGAKARRPPSYVEGWKAALTADDAIEPAQRNRA